MQVLTDQMATVHRTAVSSDSVSYTPYGFTPACLKAGYLGFLMECRGADLLAFGNGVRFYSTVAMRFLQPDPVSPFGKGGLNSYSYAKQDPINWHDKSGLAPLSWLGKLKNNFDFMAGSLGAGTTQNVRAISPGVFLFDDATKSGSRLNIIAHGGMHENLFHYIASEDGLVISHRTFLNNLSQHQKSFSDYRTVRTLVCYSGDPTVTGKTFGQTIANYTGLPTKSYIGKVSVSSHGLEAVKLGERRDISGKAVVVKMNIPYINKYRPVTFLPNKG